MQMKVTESITKKAQAILFQPSMDILEFLENGSFEVHFDATIVIEVR